MKSTSLNARDDHVMRVEIGRRLRQIRKSKGWLGDVIVERTTITRSRLSRLENGLVRPRLEELAELLDAMRADEHEKRELLRILDASPKSIERVTRKTFSSRQARLQQLETAANVVRVHAPYVPSLLQTIAYMNLVAPQRATPKERALSIRIMLDRQQLLHESRKTFVVLFAEQAIRDPALDATMRADLCAHLRLVASLPSVTIGLIDDQHWPTDVTSEITQLDDRLVIVTEPTEQVELDENAARSHIDAFEKLSKLALFDDAFSERLRLLGPESELTTAGGQTQHLR